MKSSWVRWSIVAMIAALLLVNLVVITFQARTADIGGGLAALYLGVPTLLVVGLLIALLVHASRHEVALLEKYLRTAAGGSVWFVFAKTPVLTASLSVFVPGGVRWADPAAGFAALSLSGTDVTVWDDPRDPHAVITFPASAIVRIAPGDVVGEEDPVAAVVFSVGLNGRTADLPFVPYSTTGTGARVMPNVALETLLGELREAQLRTV